MGILKQISKWCKGVCAECEVDMICKALISDIDLEKKKIQKEKEQKQQ